MPVCKKLNNRSCVVFLAAVLISVLQPAIVLAQAGAFGESFPVGSLAGIGNCDAMIAGQVPGMSFNPAHAAWGDTWSIAGGYRRLYKLDYFQRVWGTGKYSRKQWGVGISVTRFGKEDFYTETEVLAAFGWRLKRDVAIGFGLKNMRLAYTPTIPDYSGWSLDLGAIVRPASGITIAGAIGNAVVEDFIPGYTTLRNYRFSAAADISGDIFLGIGWSKGEGDRDLLGLAQKIRLARNFTFLSALYFDPARYALGGELELLKQTICYCYLSHPELGGTHYIEFEIHQ